MKYGYVRVSTPKQNIERQIRNIVAVCPEAIIIKEVYTRTSFYGRKEWNRLMKLVKCILRASTATVAFFNGRIAEQNGRM